MSNGNGFFTQTYSVVGDASGTWGTNIVGGATNVIYTVPQPVYVDNTAQPPVEAALHTTVNQKTNEISPKLYVKFVHSKMNHLQHAKLRNRMRKLKVLIESAKLSNQQAFYEELAKVLAIVIRESEAYACNVKKYVDRSVIDKWRHNVKEKVIRFEELEKFPRTIPSKVQKVIADVKERNLFDKYHVLFIDYTKEQPKKTNKEKIREKDPILFGSYVYQPDRFYFITDWVDEYCDLTFDKFIEKVQVDSPDFEATKVPDIDEVFMGQIKQEVMDRVDRLNGTNRNTYKDLMKEEDKVRIEKEIREKLEAEMRLKMEKEAASAPKKKGFFSRFKKEKKDAATT
jgi:hypothetical protein